MSIIWSDFLRLSQPEDPYILPGNQLIERRAAEIQQP